MLRSLRLVLLLTCIVTVPAAAFGGTKALVGAGGFGLAITSAAAWFLVFGIGCATFLRLAAGRRSLGFRHAVAGMGLLALGAFALAWGIQVGRHTGDMEYPILLVEFLVLLQGALMIVVVLRPRGATR